MKKIILEITCLLILFHFDAYTQESFIFEQYQISPGEVFSFNLPVITSNKDSTVIPITIINGKEKGPILGLIAGIHGSEYPPIIALQKLKQSIDPAKLKGTLILVHMASVKAFFGRNVYYNPVDFKNLNRQFPGLKGGSLTEVIAWTISNKIIPKCDYLVDIHAGDANENLHPYVAYYEWGEQAPKAKGMAQALGFPWIIVSANVPKEGQPTMYCTAEAVSQRIPTVAIEYGERGQVSLKDAEYINNALHRLMKHLQILPGKSKVKNQAKIITKRAFITSEHTGIFYTELKRGDSIRKGMKLGVITDLFGNHIQDILSPVDGFVVYMVATPPINKGETLFSLAIDKGKD